MIILIKDSTIFQDEYGVNYSQVQNIKIAEDMLSSMFLDGEELEPILFYEHVRNLFYEHRVLFHFRNGIMTEYFTTDPFISDVGNSLRLETFSDSSPLSKQLWKKQCCSKVFMGSGGLTREEEN